MNLYKIIFLTSVLFLIACSNNANIPTKLDASSLITNQDILKIGLNPTIPTESKNNPDILKVVNGNDLSEFLTNFKAKFNPDDETNLISLMSSSGGVLTIWATKPGNWLWGYTPKDSIVFRGARIWSIITLKSGEVMFKNYQQNTCISAYNNGVIHLPCNENSPSQRWKLQRFSNQAWQIKNPALNKCLQTPTFRKTTFYSIFLTNCASKNNLDQQWYITPPLFPTEALFTTN